RRRVPAARPGRSGARHLPPGAGPRPGDPDARQARGEAAHPRGQGPVKGVLAALLVAAAACSSTPSKSECDGIVEHLIDVFTAGKLADDDAAKPKEYAGLVEKWRSVLKDGGDATRESLMNICTSQLSSSSTGCVMAARSETDLARCFSP